MKKEILVIVAAVALVAGGMYMPTTDASQVAGASMLQIKVDVGEVMTGYRGSQIIGNTVYNDKKVEIGSIDDLIVTRDHGISYAIVSVGGFLGIGSKLVAVPFYMLHDRGGRVVLPHASEKELEALPEFRYAS